LSNSPAAEALVPVFERFDERIPRRRHFRSDRARDEGAVFLEQGVDRGGDVLGVEVGESRQAGKIEKRVHVRRKK
jgi:hypothetical protein